jgi:hypothetical protein
VLHVADDLENAHQQAMQLLKTLGTADSGIAQHLLKLPAWRFTSRTCKTTAALLKAAFDRDIIQPATDALRKQVGWAVGTPADSSAVGAFTPRKRMPHDDSAQCTHAMPITTQPWRRRLISGGKCRRTTYTFPCTLLKEAQLSSLALSPPGQASLATVRQV